MTLSSLFDTRFGRIAILAFTVIYVVATSDPNSTWSKNASTPAETVTIASGATLTRKVTFDASQDGNVEFFFDGTTDPVAHVMVTTCPNGATPAAQELQRYGTTWSVPQQGFTDAPDPVSVGNCSGASPSTFEIDIKNLGPAETTLTWHSTATIVGPDDVETAPPGAHVAITVTP